VPRVGKGWSGLLRLSGAAGSHSAEIADIPNRARERPWAEACASLLGWHMQIPGLDWLDYK
jgi:hypothetical protein